MTEYHSLTELPEGFDGRVRLFPLPGLVMFPHVLQPLHIFEPRYCDMLEAALAGDRLITMATLADGWETQYEGRPNLERPVCVGRILMHSKAAEGHNILLLGLRRATIRSEMVSEAKRYRVAQVDCLEDLYQVAGEIARTDLKRRLLEQFKSFVADVPLVRENLKQLADQLLPLGPVTDLAAFAAPLTIPEKLRLLAEPDVDQRARWLIDWMEQMANNPAANDVLPPARSKSSDFPPPFSDN